MIDPEILGRQLAITFINWMVGWPLSFVLFLTFAKVLKVGVGLVEVAEVTTIYLICSTIPDWIEAFWPKRKARCREPNRSRAGRY